TGYLALATLDEHVAASHEAIRTLERGLERIPDDSILLQSLAELCIAHGDGERAEKLIARLEKLPANRTRTAYLYGLKLILDHKLIKAIQILEGVRSAHDAPPELVSRAGEHLGKIARALGDYRRELAAYGQAVEANPASISARLCYATALLSAGRIDD